MGGPKRPRRLGPSEPSRFKERALMGVWAVFGCGQKVCSGLFRQLTQLNVDGLGGAVAEDGERDLGTGAFERDDVAQACRGVDRGPLDLEDDVSSAQASFGGWAVGLNAANEHALGAARPAADLNCLRQNTRSGLVGSVSKQEVKEVINLTHFKTPIEVKQTRNLTDSAEKQISDISSSSTNRPERG